MKTKHTVIILTVVIPLLILNSCAPVYVPNVLNAPMLTNKGEIQASAHFGTAGFDPQLAYAITNNLGIMINASFLDVTSDTTSTADFYHKHTFFEFGPGYYRNLGKGFKFETYAGYGFGKINGDYENALWTSRTNVNTTRFFLQPTFGYTSKIMDIGISSRLVIVTFDQNSEKNTGIMIEPAVTAKLGWDHIKIVGQLGLSYPLNSNSVHFQYQPGLFSLGLMADFGKVFK
jgi:hypothetical protein